ncbi:MAG: outer membrane beta-barrel protein [Verrucomicrobiota bacterium]
MYKHVITLIAILATAVGLVQAADPAVTTSTNDPMVMKIYPDGTKVVVRWSEIGKAIDNGEKHGGSPRIIAYDPGKDGIVPIGQPAATVSTPPSTLSQMPSEPSVITPEQKNDQPIMEKTNDGYLWGSKEGFSLKASAGPAWISSINTTVVIGGVNYNLALVGNPGIRFDVAPGYNFNEYFRFEVETAFIYNQGHRATYSGGDLGGTKINDYENNRFGFSSSGGYQVPIIPQVVFTIPIDDVPIRPYFSGGFGPSWLSINYIDALGTGVDLYSSSWNCAWQASAGVDINVAEGIDLSLSYKALGTINPNLQGTGSTQSFYTQSANIGLTCRF